MLPRQNNESNEILLVFKHSKEVTSTFCMPVATLFPDELGRCDFGVMLGKKVIIGLNSDLYQYKIDTNECVYLQSDNKAKYDWECGQWPVAVGPVGCAMNDEQFIFSDINPRYCINLLHLKVDGTFNRTTTKADASTTARAAEKQAPCLKLPADKQEIGAQSVYSLKMCTTPPAS